MFYTMYVGFTWEIKLENIYILKNNNWTLTECCAGGDWERDDKNIDIASDVDIPNKHIILN